MCVSNEGGIGEIPTKFPMDYGGVGDLNTLGEFGSPSLKKDWGEKAKKFGKGFFEGGGLSGMNQQPEQPMPFQFSPLETPQVDNSPGPFTQSIISQLVRDLYGQGQ